MQGTQGNLASGGRGFTPSPGDSVARGSFSAAPDGSIAADTNVTGNGSLQMTSNVTGPSGQTTQTNISETSARQEIEQIASEPGNSALKMSLAQQGISLTDHSDVGPGKRFATFAEKLKFIMKLKTSLLVAIMMSMASSSGWGPSANEDVTSARDALREGRNSSAPGGEDA